MLGIFGVFVGPRFPRRSALGGVPGAVSFPTACAMWSCGTKCPRAALRQAGEAEASSTYS